MQQRENQLKMKISKNIAAKLNFKNQNKLSVIIL